jgi:hypothetical protein
MKDRFGFDESKAQGTQFWRRPHLSRRIFFEHAGAAVSGYFLLPELTSERVARAGVTTKKTARQCIFILMRGGPSHIDTFDLKEGAWTPRDLEPTAYGAVRWPRGLLPKLAENIAELSLLRSAKAWALVHGLAQVWVQIGRNPIAASSRIAPHIGSVVSLEMSAQEAVLPAFVSLNVLSGIGNGWLAPDHAPFFAVPGGNGLANTRHNDGTARFDRRYGLLLEMDAELRTKPDLGAAAFQTQAYNLAARRLVYNDKIDTIFTFGADERTRYGGTAFGNSCIAARNMIRANAGARFIQISSGDWDHHDNIWVPNAGHYRAAREFDLGLGSLIADLKSDGLLNDTLIVAMGEFGRTTGALNAARGRDHFAQQAILFAGGGIPGGRVVGSTNSTGSVTTEPGWSRQRDVRPEDVEATIYSALGIDWTTIRRDDPTGRGFEYVPEADKDKYGPVHELWG